MKKKLTKKQKIEEKKQYSKRLLLTGAVFVAFLGGLCVRIGYIQFGLGPEYKLSAYKQQTTNKIISPKRGIIYDRNGEILAQSISVDTVSINPGTIKYSSGKVVPAEVVSTAFSQIFSLDYEETLAKVNSEKSVETIARKVDKTVIESLENWMKENKVTSGINIDEDSKRFYPFDSLAANVLGFCGNDNQGLEGIESKWDDVLTGTAGKIVTTTNVNNKAISDDNELYVPPENGSNLYLTIDTNIQSIVEKYLENAAIEQHCARGANAIVMEPSTGNILAMATYPTYNLNDPFSVEDISIWKNRAVTDGYEPGSTFKLITSSIGLEEDLVETDDETDFYCGGYYHVGDRDIYCWANTPHYNQSLRSALMFSCNPSLMQLGERIGIPRFYKYLRAYGFFDKPNSGLSGEVAGYFYDEDKAGEVELATMSFGQRFTITPLHLITAISAICNDGVLVTPKIVNKVENTDTGAITTYETNNVRQVISKETSEKIRDMMESVVLKGTGQNAQVSGYSIGGKSGTSEPSPGKEEEGYVASFVAITPIENTQVVVLVILYDPNPNKEGSHQGGTIAAPVASQILSEILPILGIESNSDEEDESYVDLITVNNVVGKTVAEAKNILSEAGFDSLANLEGDENTTIVTEQFPKPGSQLQANSIICLYTAENETRTSVQIPNLKSISAWEATGILKNLNLNIRVEGTGNTIVSQDPLPDTLHEEGTIVTVKLKSEIISGQ